MFRRIRWFLRKYRLQWILPAMVPVVLIFFTKGCYIAQQATGQLEVRLNQISIKKAIVRENNPTHKALLYEIPNIVKFGTDILLLKKSQNYTDYYKTEKKGITFVVTAAPKLKLEAYRWWYPIIGELPFRGYFDESDARAFADTLEKNGLDVYVFAAPAYSTLGWFKDPVTTPMLNNGLPSLVNSILHEMTHQTRYVKNEADYNEALATFVGVTGTEQYILQNIADGAGIIQRKKHSKLRYKKFSELMALTKKQLRILYNSELPDQEKLTRREIIFSRAAEETLTIYPNKTSPMSINNARLMQISRYRKNNPVFKTIWKEEGGRWDSFWKRVKSDQEQSVARFHSLNK